MADKFIAKFATLIADHPADITIDRVDVDDTFSEIKLNVHPSDTGKLIGKGGKMISSIKSIISGCKAKENRSYRLIIESNES